MVNVEYYIVFFFIAFDNMHIIILKTIQDETLSHFVC